MQFEKVHIGGYGRLQETAIEFAPGFQVIAGPNEQGKSTLRHFIADMLYGQRQPGRPDRYEDSRELRTPWSGNGTYGGSMWYALNAGQSFRVDRSFATDNDSVQIFDGESNQDVSEKFPLLKNAEPAYAETHLLMPKSVFLGMATIAHLTLAEFGDRESLQLIRDKLLSLTDSGDEKRTAEAALIWLNERMQAIGPPAARNRPLPHCRSLLMDLQAEYQDVHEARQEASLIQKQRQGVLEETGVLLHQQSKLGRELRDQSEAKDEERSQLETEVREELRIVNARIESLQSLKDFPLDLTDGVNRLSTLLEQADGRLERTTEELQAHQADMDQELERLKNKGVDVMKEVEPRLETELAEYEDRFRILHDRLDSANTSLTNAREKLEEAETALEPLPDFNKLSIADPVEWYSQLAASFESSRKARDEDSRLLAETKKVLTQKEIEFAPLQTDFEGFENFPESIRAYEDTLRNRENRRVALDDETTQWEQRATEWQRRQPGTLTMFFVSSTGFVFFLLLPWFTGIAGFYLVAIFIGLMSLYYGGSAWTNRRYLRRTAKRLNEIDAEQRELAEGLAPENDPIVALMESSDLETVRELEAYYEEFRSVESGLFHLISQRDAFMTRAEEARGQVAELLTRLTERFGEVDEEVADEDDVQPAALRVIKKYQDFREAKRRATEWRDRLNRYEEESQQLDEQLDEIREADLGLSLQVREFMRENNFADESKHDSALKAVRAYRIRSAQSRQKQGVVDVSQGQIKMLRQRLHEEEQERDDLRQKLHELLQQAEVSTLDAFHETATQAKRLDALEQKRENIKGRLLRVQQGLPIDLEPVEDEMDVEDTPDGPESEADIRDEFETNESELEAKRKQEHALHIMMMERTAGLRTLNEVDEERDDVAQRMRELELELQAAQHATEAIESVTKERHARVAPKLAERASTHLKTITSGQYTEVLLDQGMHIRVRIPEMPADDTDPERRLSKGTVDQIYFAFRLAMVQCVSDESEPLPMLLDDPFANYDDARLARAMELLSEVSETHQILLFTCREDVVRAAEAVNASILRLQ